MQYRLRGLAQGLFAGAVVLLITLGVAGLLAITVIGLPLALLVLVSGSLFALMMPFVGLCAPQELSNAILKRKQRV